MSNVEVSVDNQTWWQERLGAWGDAGKRFERVLPSIWSMALLISDVALILGAFLLAYWVRFVAPDDTAAALDLTRYVAMGIGVSLVTAVLFAFHGLYDADRPVAWPTRLYTIISVLSTALVISVSVSFIRNEDGFSRLWFAAGWAFSVLGLAFWRTVAQRLYTSIHAAVTPADRVLIVGANQLGQELAEELAGHYEVLGYVDNGSDLNGHASWPLLGPIARLDEIVHTYAIDEIVIALPPERREQAANLIARGFRRHVTVKFVPDLGTVLPQRFEVQQLAGRPYIGFVPVPRVSWAKRALDIVVGAGALLGLAPLLLAIAAAIKLDSTGPVFYRQERVGKDGRPFSMFKFRSMRQGAERSLPELRDQNEATGPLFKIRNDPRVTRVGRILRRLSLDELPQIFNVLRGEMSLVGPRPPLASEVDQYDEWQLGRLRAVPGMTGLWQVSGRSEVPFHDMVRLDLHYIRNWSLGLDLEILLRTMPAVLSNRGAY